MKFGFWTLAFRPSHSRSDNVVAVSRTDPTDRVFTVVGTRIPTADECRQFIYRQTFCGRGPLRRRYSMVCDLRISAARRVRDVYLLCWAFRETCFDEGLATGGVTSAITSTGAFALSWTTL